MFLKVGKIASFHGVKSEVKILSDFEYKQDIFQKNKHLYLGDDKTKEVIKNYRHHKNHDLITFEGYTNVNEVYKYRNLNVYVLKEELDQNKQIVTDLIGYSLKEEKILRGIITDVRILNNKQKLLEVKTNKEKVLVPYQESLIRKIDHNNKEIIIIKMEGLFDEN